MALDDWQANPALVQSAKELFATALWRQMLGVLYTGLPVRCLRFPGSNPVDAALALGHIEGYVDCLNVLQALAKAAPETVNIPTTWGAAPAPEEAANG